MFVAVPLSAMILSYVLIYVKIWKSQRSLDNLGMAAFNKHQNEVSIWGGVVGANPIKLLIPCAR